MLRFDQPVIALQGALSGIEISTGTAMTMFCQYFGGTVFLAIAKSLFENGLRKALGEYAPNVDPNLVINAGAVTVFDKLPPAEVGNVILAYNKALAATFVSRLRGHPTYLSVESLLTSGFAPVATNGCCNSSVWVQFRFRVEEGCVAEGEGAAGG